MFFGAPLFAEVCLYSVKKPSNWPTPQIYNNLKEKKKLRRKIKEKMKSLYFWEGRCYQWAPAPNPTEDSGKTYWLRLAFGAQQARSTPCQNAGKSPVTGGFFSLYCLDVSALNIHTWKGLFVMHTQRNPLTMRNKHNPIAQLNTQLNLKLERDGPVVCLQC